MWFLRKDHQPRPVKGDDELYICLSSLAAAEKDFLFRTPGRWWDAACGSGVCTRVRTLPIHTIHCAIIIIIITDVDVNQKLE